MTSLQPEFRKRWAAPSGLFIFATDVNDLDVGDLLAVVHYLADENKRLRDGSVSYLKRDRRKS
jgi:hypothetical protein